MKAFTLYINAWYSKLYRFIYGPEAKLTDIQNIQIFVFKLLFGTLLLLPMLVTYNVLTSLFAIYLKTWLIKNEYKYLTLQHKEAIGNNLDSVEFNFYLKYQEMSSIYYDCRYDHAFPTFISSIFYLSSIIISSIAYDIYIIIHGIINNYDGLTYILNFNSPVLFKDDFALLGTAFLTVLTLVGIIFGVGKLIEYILYKTDDKTIDLTPKENIKWNIKS